MPRRCRRSRYSEMATEKLWNEGEVGRVKCVLVGDGAIGKTSLIFNYTTNVYPIEYVPTAYDNYKVVVTVNEKPIRLQICDTAGQDDFDSLRPFAYKDPATDVYLLCFSVVIPSSFENVTLKWLPEIRKYSPNAPVVLVGTQSDLRQDPQTLIDLSRYGEKPVSEIAAHRLANEIKAELYIESSALTQKNLKKVFDEAILSAIRRNKELESLTIGRSQGKKISRSRSKEKEQPKESLYRERKKKKPLWRRIFCFFR